MNFDCQRTCREHGDGLCRFQFIFDRLGPVQVDSHVAKIDTKILDLDALSMACQRLGLEFKSGQTRYRWWGSSAGDYPVPNGLTVDDLGKCVHAISVPGFDHVNRDKGGQYLDKNGAWQQAPYEVGLIQNADGSFTFVWDFFEGGYGMQEKVGENCGKLLAEYSMCVAEKAAQERGWQYQRVADGLEIFHPHGGSMTVKNGIAEAHGFAGNGCHDALQQLGLSLIDDVVKPEAAMTVAKVQVARR
jgi:hypothetical protein